MWTNTKRLSRRTFCFSKKEVFLHLGKFTTSLTICEIEITALKPLPKGCPVNPSSIGDYLKQYRIAHSYTAFELALELEVYDSTIYKWEHGLTKPSPENTQKIIEFIGYDPRIQKPLKTENYELT